MGITILTYNTFKGCPNPNEVNQPPQRQVKVLSENLTTDIYSLEIQKGFHTYTLDLKGNYDDLLNLENSINEGDSLQLQQEPFHLGGNQYTLDCSSVTKL